MQAGFTTSCLLATAHPQERAGSLQITVVERAAAERDCSSNFQSPLVFFAGATLSANTQQQGVSARSGDRLTATKCCDKCSALPEQLPWSRAQLPGQGGQSVPPRSLLWLQLEPGCCTLPSPSCYLFTEPESLCLQALLLPPLILSKSLHGGQRSWMLLPARPKPLVLFTPPPLERFLPGFYNAPAVSPLQGHVKEHLWLLTPLRGWGSPDIALKGPELCWSWSWPLPSCFPETFQRSTTRKSWRV